MKAGVLFVRPEKLDKLSFSHALAKSVILGDLETKTEKAWRVLSLHALP
jgi:uncharacterized Rmd1/YagE family protein